MWQGMYLTDLTFIDDGNVDMIEGGGGTDVF
jgi:hypothetical protein